MRKVQGWMAAASAALALCSLAGAARASSASAEAEQRQVWDDVARAASKGPVDVPLLDEAVLHVPAGEVFVPQPQADRLLNLLGNPGANPDMPGLLLPRDPRARWYMPIHFHKTGHVRDDDARTWNADELLRGVRADTDAQNRAREKAHMPGMEVEGWSQPPTYDAARQRLVWVLTSHEVDAKPDAPRTVNYNAFALGRDGFFSMNLVAALDDLPALRPVADQQLAALEYNPGKRYADFDPKTDRVAAFGLGGLVADMATRQLPAVLGHIRDAGPLAMGSAAVFVVLLVTLFVMLRRKRRAEADAARLRDTGASAQKSPHGA